MSRLQAMALLCGLVLLVVPMGGCSLLEKKTTPYEGYAFLDRPHFSIRETCVGSLDDLDVCHTANYDNLKTHHWS